MIQKYTRILVKLFFCLAFVLIASCRGDKKQGEQTSDIDPYFEEFIPQLGKQANTFALQHGLNEEYCILVDYAIPSGQPRVFLWSFAQKKVVFQAHTMHGPGGGSTKENAVLSNVLGSNCSASGPFAITKEHGTINPDGFFLRGLSTANSNARQRALMLHGANIVDAALYRHPKYLPIDAFWCSGCVTVSEAEMEYLHNLIMSQKKLLLLWAFCSDEIEL